MKFDLSSHYPKTAMEYWWKDLRLTQSYTELEKADLSGAPLILILKELGRNLGFLDHVSIIKGLRDYVSDFNTDEYFQAVGFTHVSYLIQALETVAVLPTEFVDWAREKKLSPKDLRLFFGIEIPKVESFITHTAKLNPSKSEGLLILEYGLDLIYKNTFEKQFFEISSSEQLLKALKRKRFYKTLSADDSIDHQISKIDFGADSKVKTLRDGDKRLLHIEVKSSHPQKLKSSLERITKNLSKIEDKWT